MPGVADALAQLGTRHDLLLLTKGQPDEQQRKIDASGLAHHFRSTHIVAEKRARDLPRPGRRARLAPERDLDDRQLAGSDILAGPRRGVGAVFIPHAYTWSLEHDEIDPADRGVLHLARFPELLEHF